MIARKLIICFLLLPFSSPARQNAGSHPYADSLQRVLQASLSNEQRAQNLFLLSQYWADLDSAKGVQYALQALEYNPHDNLSEGKGHYYLGNVFFEYDIPRAQQEYMLAIPLLQHNGTQKAFALLSKAWHNYGALEERQGHEKQFAGILLNKVIPLALQAGDTLHTGNYYLSLSVVFGNIYDYEKAISYAKKAVEVFRQYEPGSELLLDCYNKVAEHYISRDDFAAAKPFLDSARYILQRYPSSIHAPSYYQNEGRYYNGTKDLPRAMASFRQGLIMAERLNRQYNATTIMMEQYQVYKAQHKLDTARQILLSIYHRPYVREMPENMKLVLRELASTDSALNHPQAAYSWLVQYMALADSLTASQSSIQIRELEAKYNYADKEREVLKLNAKTTRQDQLLWATLGLLLMATLVFFYFYRQRKFKATQQLQYLQQEKQVAVTQAVLEAEEQERTRLARDLHDGLGSILAGIKINLSELSGQESGLVKKMIGRLDNAVSELRRIARNLMPEALLRSGLETALEDLCQSVVTDKMNVVLQTISIARDLPVQVQIIVYRIVQELLANAVKHAMATEVLVQCSQLDDVFYITVEDNGKGFASEAPAGMGLENIRNRVDFLQGKMEIRAMPGKGTAINIELKCQH